MKRSRHTIVAQILDICNSGATKTRIVYQVNLNFRTVGPYIELLTRNGLIESNSGRTILYKTTTKGLRLRDNLKQVDDGLLLT
jgi:predicted transcriptional regulator